MLLNQHLEFSGVKGIDRLDLHLSDEKMNVLIGANGVGKTKTLESLYALLFFSNNYISSNAYLYRRHLVFEQCWINGSVLIKRQFEGENTGYLANHLLDITFPHHLPVVYLAAQNRGEIRKVNHSGIKPLGEFEERRKAYFDSVLQGMGEHFSTLNMNTSIEEWFIQRANSSNGYQDEQDNREVELLAVLRVLNKIDSRISADKRDFKVIGGKSVSILLDGQPRRLNELSSGFASLIKIVQSIIAGYSFFTNATDIEQVKGYVLIDEIESHLHVEWQTRILPLLMDVFPNTYFVITTHSSLVLTQLTKGKAYQLVKENGIVTNREILHPSKVAFIDLLEGAFNVNLNSLKLQHTTPESQADVKNTLLKLLGEGK